MLQKLLVKLFAAALFLGCLFCFNGALGQTVNITSANSVATNGVSASPLVSSSTAAAVFGFRVQVSGGSVTFNQFVLGANQAYFTNAKLYRSAAGSNTYSGSTFVTNVSAGTYIDISGLSQTITNNFYTYFLVVDLSIPGYQSLPTNLQFSFSSAIRSSPYTTYSSGFSGTNYTVNNPSYTLTSANSAGNGITQGSIVSSQPNVVLFGFGVSANANTTVSGFNINSSTSGNYLSYYLGNGKLYRSSSSTFSFGTATLVSGASVAFSNYQNTPGVAITGLSESISASTVYYFLVADFNQTGGSLPSTIQFKFETSQTNAIVQSSPNSANIAAPSNISGTSFTFSNPSYTFTSANAAGNGITQGTLRPSQTGIVLFGFGVSANANTTVSGFNLYNTYNQNPAQAYFNNGKLYRSSSSTFSVGTATLVSGATVGFGYDAGSGMQISGLSESITSTTTYYFIVGDFNPAYYGTLPGTSQFRFLTSQSNPIVQSAPTSGNITVGSNIDGTNFSLDRASLTVTGYNSTSNGITSGALNYGQTDIVLFGFQVSVAGSVTINQINIPSNISTNAYFNNGRLYRSNTSNFSDATLIAGTTVSFPGTNTNITGLSQTLSSFSGGTSSYYYFLVADFLASTSFSQGTLQYNFVNGTTSFTQNTPNTTFNTASTSNGNSFIIGGIYDWVGTNNTSFATAANFRINGSTPGVAPTSNDLVRIGVIAYQYPSNQPTVGANTTIGKLTFGSNNSPTLTLSNNVTLTVTNGVDVQASTTAIVTGAGTTTTLSAPTGSKSTIASASSLSISGTIDLNNAGTFTTAGTLIVNDNTINSGTFNQNGTAASTFTGTFTNSGAFNQSNGTINFVNNFTNSSAGTFSATGGTVNFNRSGTQNISNANSTAPVTFNNLTISNSGTKSLSGSGTFAIKSSGIVTMAGTAAFDAAGKLTLKSDINGSAAVAAIPTGTSITGNVTVERYVSGGSSVYRGYRLFSSPVYEATVSGNRVFGVAHTKNSAYITGTTGTAGGFDATASTPTIYLYREDKTPSSNPIGGNFRGINKINNTPAYDIGVDNESGNFNLPVGNGYMFFFRGDRATNASTSTTVVPDPVIFSQTGTLNTGTVVVKNWYTPTSSNLGYTGTGTGGNYTARGYNLVGNPYPATIDWNQFSSSNASAAIYGPHVGSTIYTYNSALKVYATYNGSVGTGNGSRYITSGQGFYVITDDATASLTFTEAAKAASQQVTGANLMMGAPVAETAETQFVRLQLSKDEASKEDMVVQFSKGANNGYLFNEDSPYMRGSSAVSISSLATDNKNIALAINKVPFPKTRTSIPFNVTVNATGIYQLKLTEAKNIPKMFEVWLMDNYKKDSLDIKNNATYNFNANTAEAATFGADRFTLVVRPNTAYSYHLLDFAATKQTTAVQLTWKAENEENYTYFTVERSTNGGKSFDVIGSAASKSLSTYSLQDKAPVTGENQYRLKQEDYFGTITYSKIIPVMYTPVKDIIADDRLVNVYPNPTNANLNIAIKTTSVNAVAYSISITNTTGRTVKTITSPQPAWQGNISDLLPGTYFIQVTNNKDNSVVGKSTFIKL